MESMRRIMIMAEMHGRDLTRRHAALGLLVALPLSCYLASLGSGEKSIIAGGGGRAVAIGGATRSAVRASHGTAARHELATRSGRGDQARKIATSTHKVRLHLRQAHASTSLASSS